MLRLIHRYLEPGESLLEILFGLIMALTVTAGARLLSAPEDLRAGELALALLGCNVAWAIIDAVFHVLGVMFGRNRRAAFTRRLQATASDAEALALVCEEFDLEDEPEASDEQRAALHRSLLDFLRGARAKPARVTRDDLAAAAAIVLLVSATALPGLLPLLVVTPTHLALRIGNGLQLVLLLVIGYRWARYAGTPGWRGAAIVGSLGTLLVLLAMALGG